MAATRLIPLHKNKGKSVAACLKDVYKRQESVLRKLEEAKAAQTTKKTEAKNHTQEL